MHTPRLRDARALGQAATLCMLLLFLHARPGVTAPARPPVTQDHGRQILVTGGSLAQRVSVLRAADELRETLLKTTEQKPQSRPIARPLLIVLSTDQPPGTAPSVAVVEDPAGLKVQITASPKAEAEDPALLRAILRGLLLEMSLRPETEGEENRHAIDSLELPRWIVDGVFEAHLHPNPLTAWEALSPLLEKGAIPPVSSLLSQPENDPQPSSPAMACVHRGLLLFLVSRTDGPEGLRKLLKLGVRGVQTETLLRCFPSLGTTEADLHKAWTLHIAATGTMEERVRLSGTQTNEELEALLELDLTNPADGSRVQYRLEQFEDYARVPGVRGLLAARQLEFLALLSRAHFLYAELIQNYADACGQIANGRTAGMKARLREATLERERIAARLGRISDFLNWHEAAVAPRRESPRLREFYRILDEPLPRNPKIEAALDAAELRLKQEAERADIDRALNELNRRAKP